MIGNFAGRIRPYTSLLAKYEIVYAASAAYKTVYVP